MKQLSTLLRGVLVLCLMPTVFSSVVNAQTLTKKANTFVDANCNGYIEYLPSGYTTSKTYPLIIAYHGSGEGGDGSSSSLDAVLNNGLPGVIKNGKFPTSVTVNGSTYQFIVIAPQCRTNPDSATMEAVYQYAVSHYPVNINRVYVTGYSQGGGNTAYYVGTRLDRARKIAAILTIAVSVNLSPGWAQNIATANLPMLATANSNDAFYADNTVSNVNSVNGSNPPPSVLSAYVLLGGSGHGGWTETYTPSTFSYNGMDVYQWMLQYSRSLTTLPVVLGTYAAQQSGPSAVTVNWTTTSEINNHQFTLQRSSNGVDFSDIATIAATNQANGASYSYVDNQAIAGNNFYRLAQVDNDGKTTYFGILKVTLAGTQPTGLRISPNPVGNTPVTLQLNHPETGDIQVVLSDIQGRVLRSWKFSKTGIYWQQTLDLGNLANGNYTLRLTGATIKETQQFIKQ